MPSLFDTSTQTEMLARINKLTPSSQRKWGKMTVSQMLKHLTIAFSVPINKVQLPKEYLYYVSANPITRWLMIKAVTRWPKNLVTAEAFEVHDDPDFDNAKNEFLSVYNEFVKAKKLDGCHPVFGVMSKDMWGEAMAIHLNHHLEQFGV